MADQSVPNLSAISDQLADAVQAAGAYTVRVHGRRGVPASGIALAADLVATAEHVVDPAFEERLSVGLPDGRQVGASVVGRDPATDLAILRVPGAALSAATAAGSEPRAGSLVVLVARPGEAVSASLGLVVGHGGPARTRRGGVLERHFQVDAVMYPGFSGGPLVDASGAVLGMSTSGLSFGGPAVAIPWALVKQLSESLVKHGRVARGFLGIGSQPITLSDAARQTAGGQEHGLLVVQVNEGGPAAAAGFLQGDILIRLGDRPVTSPDDLQAVLGPERVGTPETATVVRGGETRSLTVTIGARPASGA